MAIATKAKTSPKTVHHRKRSGKHHTHGKHYTKHYWPYVPILLVVVLGFAVNAVLSKQQAVLGANTDLTPYSLLSATNDVRLERNEATLAINEQLSAAATAKAQEMAAENYWSHNTPAGKRPWSFITATGYQYQAAGENLAYGFSNATATVNGWMQSETHRANILDTNYREVGFGVAQTNDFIGKGPTTIVVALYAQPASAPLTATPTVRAAATTEPVSRVSTVAGSASVGFMIGVVGTLAIGMVIMRHSIAWRKLLNQGELFVLEHPVLDVVLVAVAVTAVVAMQTSGFIG